ncbi:FAD-dependent oxidoreductase [Streptomyces sp. TRM72054]|nr:FAD-dependent oxidoreductase [Streptomyces sp. TRM72054]
MGVIGTGICGAAAAERLRAVLGDGIELVVVDRHERVGGRMSLVNFGGTHVEGGASLFHSANKLLAGYVEALGLHTVLAGEPSSTIGVWTGSRFVFRTSGSPWRDNVAMLFRYRTRLLRLARLTRDGVSRLDRIYPMLEDGASWPTARQLLQSVDLEELTAETAAEHLSRHGCAGPLVQDFADPISRNNYGGSASEINALVELVSLAGGGLAGGRLLRVREGNEAVCRGLLDRAEADVQLGNAVRRVAPHGHGWTLYLADGTALAVDAVILAAPAELADIRLDIELPHRTLRTYKRIHATFVQGTLREGRFGGRSTPDFVLTTAEHKPFLSLERIGQDIYKLFSEASLPGHILNGLFSTINGQRELVWDAYPELTPTDTESLFAPAHRFYDATALEYFVSTMETQAIAGRAAANLLITDLCSP